ncbi:MAG: hypothetical protein QOG46_2125 [Pseudonocardiales bacterium]|jgi:hypothetical protein|nr:hypothetical protein [Pseudonocardiales bacterium]
MASHARNRSLALVLAGSRKVSRVVDKIHPRHGALRRMLAAPVAVLGQQPQRLANPATSSMPRWLLTNFSRVCAKCFS